MVADPKEREPIELLSKRGCLTLFVMVAVAVIIGGLMGAASDDDPAGRIDGGSSTEAPDSERVQFARDMCDTNEGGYYHYDEECMEGYLGP